MSVSITGQNDRWASLNAYQPTPTPPPGSGGSFDPATGASLPADPTATPPQGGTSGALSDDMSLALMAFSGWNGGTGSATAAASPDSGTSDAPAVGQSAVDPQSQILADMQSLLSTLTGTAGATAGTSATATSGAAVAAASSQSGFSDAMAQDLQDLEADLGTLASTSATAQPGGPDGRLPGSPLWSDDTSNTGTATPDGSNTGWKPGYSDGFQQQFALSAYSASATSGLDSPTTSALTDIKV